jgi:hypothetical protein
MSKRSSIGGRPAADPRIDGWVRGRNDGPPNQETSASSYTARLTIDVTPALRGRIKVAAFHRGMTVAEMLRHLLENQFPEPPNAS